MGLDMYLYRKTYIRNWSDDEDKKEFEVTLSYKGKQMKLENPKEISEEVGYWRKANQVHNWFVQNVQEGEDDCKSYEVSREQLQTLLKLCKKVKKTARVVDGDVVTGMVFENGQLREEQRVGKVIENKEEIDALLPTGAGFFFGSTEYDEFYMEDIDHTIKMLEKILKQKPPEGVLQWYEYRSSW
jgi:hypothetical protein